MVEPPITVLKLGGATCRDAASRRQALLAIGRLARRRSILVVPGGGVFADQVRLAQRAQGFSDDAAHWMAILAMDQVAHLITEELEGAVLVYRRQDIAAVLESGGIPVLAPYAWLRDADPLPHSWDITSDSIAALVARDIGARELVLVKPVDGPVNSLVDQGFATARPPELEVRIATPATLDAAFAS